MQVCVSFHLSVLPDLPRCKQAASYHHGFSGTMDCIFKLWVKINPSSLKLPFFQYFVPVMRNYNWYNLICVLVTPQERSLGAPIWLRHNSLSYVNFTFTAASLPAASSRELGFGQRRSDLCSTALCVVITRSSSRIWLWLLPLSMVIGWEHPKKRKAQSWLETWVWSFGWKWPP